MWDTIERSKVGRVIILTTHDMDEATVLSDRIGIMAKGRLQASSAATAVLYNDKMISLTQAVGTTLRLKSKYGAGCVRWYILDLLVEPLYRVCNRVQVLCDCAPPVGGGGL